ncbi:MAG: ABC transporter permease, partial [Acutalibacteraceae bacterium]
MYILKNAVRCITRSIGRWILIAIIILVIAVSTCVSLSVRQAANTSKSELLENLSVTATIGFDRSSFMKGMGGGKPQDGSFDKDSFKEKMSSMSSLELDELQKYAENENVKSFYYSLSTSVNGSDKFTAVDMTGNDSSSAESEATANESSEKGGAPENVPPDNGGKQGGRFGAQGDFNVIGYSSDEAMTDFVSGTSKIVDGAVFDEGSTDSVCIIPEELAQYNSLSVGDSITVVNPNNEKETVSLKICGIYSSDNTGSEEISGFTMSQDSANRILMSYNALKSIID